MSTSHQPQTEPIDFTLMYVTHDAFRRDLARLVAAADAGTSAAPRVQAGWRNFKRQLDVHHSVEDAALWPRLAAAVAHRPLDAGLVDEMEAEHASLDALLAAVDKAMAEDPDQLPDASRVLAGVLGAHMAHEENSALPLIQEVLTRKDWGGFRSAMARRQGPSGAAAYVPWVIDGNTPDQRHRFFAAMPAPLAVVNKLLWEPRYRKRGMWSA
jgi:iron-sulfur cluster repair protein YtfE (RIC family)